MDTTKPPARSGFWVSGLLALVGVMSCAGFLGEVATHHPRTVFCKVGLAGFHRGSEMIALQDNGEPGPGDCDGSPTLRTMRVLGLDCKLREPDGEVVEQLSPNGEDDTCVLARSYPASWTDD